MQIIVNPWEVAEKQPVVDLLNIDSDRVSGFSLVDHVEGRHRYNYTQRWPHSTVDLGARLVRWIDDLLDELLDTAKHIQTRPPPSKTATELRFPHGVAVLEEALKSASDRQGLVLRTEKEHQAHREELELRRQHEAQQATLLEGERSLAYDEMTLRLQSASSLADLNDFESKIPACLSGTEREQSLMEKLEQRRLELKPAPKPIPDWDDPDYINDTDNNRANNAGRRPRGIRTFDIGGGSGGN